MVCFLCLRRRESLPDGYPVEVSERYPEVFQIPLRVISLAALVVLLSCMAVASGDPVAGDSIPPDREIELFFDANVPALMAANHVPGAVVSVVRGNEVVFAKGYGYADPASGIPPDPDTTLVRVGSVSKVLVWIAVMQRVAAGDLDLDADINRYLRDVVIEDTYPGDPVTLRHLMTHSAGFEERVTGTFRKEGTSPEPLGTALSRGMPRRVRPPGEIFSYSNHGGALAAYAVESVSGQPFEVYAEESIFAPLSMKNSTFLQPPPPALADRVSGGFRFTGEGYERQEFEIVTLPPSGGLSTTASDMASLMVCLLNGGEIPGAPGLGDEVVSRLFSVHYTPFPGVEGWRGGFGEMHAGGRYILWHGGATLHATSLLALFPDERVGLFISFNSGEAGDIIQDLLAAFASRDAFFSDATARKKKTTRAEVTSPPRVPREVAGLYTATRGPVTSFEKVFLLFPESGQFLEARKISLHEILLAGRRLQELVPGVYAESTGEIGAVFLVSGRSGTTYLLLPNRPDTAWRKVEWFEDPRIGTAVLVTSLSLFTSLPVTWAAGVLLPPGCVTRRRLSFFHLFFATLCGLSVSFVLLLFFTLNEHPVTFGTPPSLSAILLLPWIILAMTAGAAVLVAEGWIRGRGNTRERVEFTLLAITAGIFCWWNASWNLLFPGL